MRKIVLAVIAVAALVVLWVVFGGESQPTSAGSQGGGPSAAPQSQLATPRSEASPAGYTIVSTEDNSIKAITRALSTYTVAELDSLPLNKRITVNAAIEGPITQDQVAPTLDAILSSVRASDPDADEVTVFLYSEPRLVGQGYDVGTALWAPGGQRGGVTPQIAERNDRSTYRVVYDVRQDLETYLRARSSTEVLHGLTVDQRQAYFREVVAAEARAMADADARINPNVDVMGNIGLNNDLRERYVAELRGAYGLTAEQHAAIMAEAMQKGWPMR